MAFLVLLCMLMLHATASSQTPEVNVILDREVAFDPYPSKVETIYQERLRAYKQGPAEGEVRGGLRSYEPMASVAGIAEPRALPEVATGQSEVSTEALIAAREYAGRMNSSAFMVWHRGQLIEETYFGGIGRDTPIVSRSLAKPITAIAVGRAIQLGHIASLDQPVADFITEWAADGRSEILVRHLLDMRSGLLRQGFSDDPLSIYNLTYLHPYHDELLVNHYPMTDVPGSRYEYSNATSELVAVLIERATGVRYHDWVAREVLQPIESPGGSVWVNRKGGVAHAGCCILLPPEAWLRMGVLLLGDGAWSGNQLLDPGFVKEMRTGTDQNPHAGMGVFVADRYVERRGSFHPDIERSRALHSEPYLAADLFLFDGYGNQVVYVIPSYDLVILRTGDSPPRTPEWDNSFLPNTIMRGIEMEHRPPSQPR